MENKILEISNKRKSYEIKYNDLIIEFITKAYELVELSNDVYQVEKTIKLNKISLKDFILNSDICNILKNNNIKDYTISELKKYFSEYEQHNDVDIDVYKKALYLYELLKEIEKVEAEKIEYLINSLDSVCIIKEINSIENNRFQELYNRILNSMKSRLSDEIYLKFSRMIDDIFSYYLYGNKVLAIKDKTQIV